MHTQVCCGTRQTGDSLFNGSIEYILPESNLKPNINIPVTNSLFLQLYIEG